MEVSIDKQAIQKGERNNEVKVKSHCSASEIEGNT